MDNLSLGPSCPRHNVGGYSSNAQGMTLDPYFSSMKQPGDKWSTLLKGNYDGSGGTKIAPEILGGSSFHPSSQFDPSVNLRNHLVATGSAPAGPKNGYGASTYQTDFLPPPFKPFHSPGAEQARLASLLPLRDNVYNPYARTRWQAKDDSIPKLPLICAPCTGVKVPCRKPQNNISQVHLDHGFGTYTSESKDQYDRPSAQSYGLRTYESPSGFSSSYTRHFIPDEVCNMHELKDTNPTRYNPWTRINIGFKSLLNKEYRPHGMDYLESSVGGRNASDTYSFIH